MDNKEQLDRIEEKLNMIIDNCRITRKDKANTEGLSTGTFRLALYGWAWIYRYENGELSFVIGQLFHIGKYRYTGRSPNSFGFFQERTAEELWDKYKTCTNTSKTTNKDVLTTIKDVLTTINMIKNDFNREWNIN